MSTVTKESSEVKQRAKSAWKAFSVQALVALGSLPVWYPAVSAAATAAFGPNAEIYVQATIAAAGVLGWIKPQSLVK